MSSFAQVRSQWFYAGLVVIVGWAVMASYAVAAFWVRVPAWEGPRRGIYMMDWVDTAGMRLRVAHVPDTHSLSFRIQVIHVGEERPNQWRPLAYVSRTSRWFHAMRGRTVPWNGDDVPVAGWAVQVEEWPDVDVWIVGPLVFYD